MFHIPPSTTTAPAHRSAGPHPQPIRFSSPPSATDKPLKYSPSIPTQPQATSRAATYMPAGALGASSVPVQQLHHYSPSPPPVSQKNTTTTTTSSAAFDIRKLYNREKNRDDHRQELYDSIVRKVHHRVETVAQRKETQCLFNIPQFILGMPLYDPFQCTGYVIQTLKAQGFHVKYFHPNTLFIDWSRHLIEPFVNAMDRREASREAAMGVGRGGGGGGGSVGDVGPLDLNYVPSGKLFGN